MFDVWKVLQSKFMLCLRWHFVVILICLIAFVISVINLLWQFLVKLKTNTKTKTKNWNVFRITKNFPVKVTSCFWSFYYGILVVDENLLVFTLQSCLSYSTTFTVLFYLWFWLFLLSVLVSKFFTAFTSVQALIFFFWCFGVQS